MDDELIEVDDLERIKYRLLQIIKKNDKLLKIRGSISIHRMTTDMLRRIPLKTMKNRGI